VNVARPRLALITQVIGICLTLRKLMPRRTCHSFGVQGARNRPSIEKIYVINLDRETDRWSKIEQELWEILDRSGATLLSLAERHVAVDAAAFSQDPLKDENIDPRYTLADQLFVEPQPLTLPTRFELDAEIRMSRAEVAVALSHVNVWKRVAASDHPYALVLEDDVWFHPGFARHLDQAWDEVVTRSYDKAAFDVLYVSYLEVKHGAPKPQISGNVFRPLRGLWHLSGYVLSREGAEKLLRLLPCRGPVDLWINHQFRFLHVLATRRSLVSQRRDARSSNSYSVLPALSRIGAINSEGASLFNIRPSARPVFAFGPEGSGHSSLAMALSMLGYRCCSDLQTLPAPELARLLEGSDDRVFDAYVNIGSLNTIVNKLRRRYPQAKFILTAGTSIDDGDISLRVESDLDGADTAVFYSASVNPWKVVCEHLRCAPPASSFPTLRDIGQRPLVDGAIESRDRPPSEWARSDKSPWIVEPRRWWRGIRCTPTEAERMDTGTLVSVADDLKCLDEKRWVLRSDTFTDNLALFRPSNVAFNSDGGAALSVKSEALGVRDYSAASLSTRDHYLYGRFEADIQASDVLGVVTGFFLHRNSPRQEIDIEIAGSRPDRLLVNVFYNPGGEGAQFDYGYRGAPSYIDLGFDASKARHRFAIEWSPCEIRWLVDDRLVYRRVMWDPTPIPHLPMAVHVNIWPSRSTQLAGRMNARALPAITMVRSIRLTANCVTASPSPADLPTSSSAGLFSEIG